MLNIFTLTWNGLDKLTKLKESLYPALKDINYHWWIRDNGSKDKTVDIASQWKNTTVFPIGHNRNNFAQGINYLFKESQAEDNILLLNNDVIFNDTESLKKMLDLKEKTKSDVVGAKLLYTNTNSLQHAGVIFGQRYGKMPYHFKHKETNDSQANKNRHFQAVTAACSIVSADAFKSVGGMDEKFSWAFEDIDLCLKINKLKNDNIVYCGDTNIFHEESATLNRNPLNKLFMPNNVLYFKSKWFGKYDLDHEKYLKDKNYRLVST